MPCFARGHERNSSGMILFFVSFALFVLSARLFWFGRRTTVGCSRPMLSVTASKDEGILCRQSGVRRESEANEATGSAGVVRLPWHVIEDRSRPATPPRLYPMRLSRAHLALKSRTVAYVFSSIKSCQSMSFNRHMQRSIIGRQYEEAA